jgi:hypothetical protein
MLAPRGCEPAGSSAMAAPGQCNQNGRAPLSTSSGQRRLGSASPGAHSGRLTSGTRVSRETAEKKPVTHAAPIWRHAGDIKTWSTGVMN